MTETGLYKVIFSGDIIPGQNLAQVKGKISLERAYRPETVYVFSACSRQ
ncbi:MAG: hypothetical protein R6V54_04965 [Desulfobacteraceae bacterium]